MEILKQKEFGRYLSELREQAGYDSQRQLALAAKVNPATVSRIEAGTQHPEPDTLVKLAPALGVSPEVLMVAAGYLEPRTESVKDKDLPLVKTKRLADSIMRAKDLPDENVDQIADALEALIEHHKRKTQGKNR